MKKTAPFLILTAGSMWGCMGVLVRTLNRYGLEAMDITALRSAVTCVCVAIGLLFFRRDVFYIRLKDIWCFIGTGIFSITFFNYCYFHTMLLTSLSAAAILLYTAPAFVMLLSAVLFKEKLTLKKLAALFLAFGGCILISNGAGNGTAIQGSSLLIGLGAGLGYALYSIFGKFAIDRGYSSFTITFYTFLFASAGTFPFADRQKIAVCFAENKQLILLVFLLIILTTVAPYFIYTLGLSYMEAGKASVIASIEPAAATLVGIIVYQEIPGMLGIAGILLVIGSIFLLNINIFNIFSKKVRKSKKI